jgi:hypothetical protein
MACGCGKSREERMADRLARMSPAQREAFAARQTRIDEARAEKARLRAAREAQKAA